MRRHAAISSAVAGREGAGVDGRSAPSFDFGTAGREEMTSSAGGAGRGGGGDGGVKRGGSIMGRAESAGRAGGAEAGAGGEEAGSGALGGGAAWGPVVAGCTRGAGEAGLVCGLAAIDGARGAGAEKGGSCARCGAAG